MGLRDLLKKRNESTEGKRVPEDDSTQLEPPQFTFIRSDTTSEEVIEPPAYPEDSQLSGDNDKDKLRRNRDIFHGRSHSGRSNSSSSAAAAAAPTVVSPSSTKKDGRRISQRLHLSRQSVTSENVPDDLPDIMTPAGEDGAELEWEQRATILAERNEIARALPSSPLGVGGANARASPSPSQGDNGSAAVSSLAVDDDIQEAIRLHDEGKYERSTQIFGRLADPQGANNPLSQVLYGLALR